MRDSRIIRHWRKILATRTNAIAMTEIATEHGSFADWLVAWPVEDTVGLWEVLQKRFSQLGGMSGPMFLRWVGKDTFMLSPDVVCALNDLGIARVNSKARGIVAQHRMLLTFGERKAGRRFAGSA